MKFFVILLFYSNYCQYFPLYTMFHLHNNSIYICNNANVPYTTIAKLVGHDTTEMIIKIYAHPINDEKEEFRLVENIYL